MTLRVTLHRALPLTLLLSGLGAALAQTAPPAPPPPSSAPAAPAAPAAPGEYEIEVDERVEAARERLDAAARELAELTMDADGPVRRQIRIIGHSRPQAIIGVQLDSAASVDGAKVQRVSPGGAAAEAGILAGDVITDVDGRSLKGVDQGSRALIEYMRGVKPDQKLKLTLRRDGKARDVTLTARAAPPLPDVTAMPMPAIPMPVPRTMAMPGHGARPFDWRGMEAGVAGLELATLTPTLGSYFGTERGVLVVRAPRDAAWKLQDGDVLLAIDGREPTSGQHATRILRSYQSGEQLKLRLMRQRKPLDLQVKVPDTDVGAGAVRMRARAPD